MSLFVSTYNSPVGEILIGSHNGVICMVDWKYRRMRSAIDKRIQEFCKESFVEKKTMEMEVVIQQFQEYFAGKRNVFDIELEWIGTSFQKEVWTQLIEIPYGKTTTYMDLAKKLRNPGAVRAVASANGANAISIIVPCHRVVGAKGELTGYAGGLNVKKKLLQLENSDLNQQMSLF